MTPPRWWLPSCVAALALHAVLAIHCILSMSPAVDENEWLPIGAHHWLTGDFSLGRQNPPLAKLALSLPLFLSLTPHEREVLRRATLPERTRPVDHVLDRWITLVRVARTLEPRP
ncbi:MAG: hypothetical protein K2W96_25035, partial [Gemmataceae bacterium]|nr:hypothetical protein [Gemmataceae bacterium]